MSDVMTTRVWDEYKTELEYQSGMGFCVVFPAFEKFKEG